MNIHEDPISEVLDIKFEESLLPIKKKEEEPAVGKEEHLDKDYISVRKNLKNIIKQAEVAIDGILEVATESESPRAYEVVSQLIHSSLDANSKLIELHKKMKEIEKKDENSGVTNITNNAIFMGSTAELQKFLTERKKNLLEDKNATEEH
jgi:dTDP-D-glucose 4,6-dehydratase